MQIAIGVRFLIQLNKFSGTQHGIDKLPVFLITAGTPMDTVRTGQLTYFFTPLLQNLVSGHVTPQKSI